MHFLIFDNMEQCSEADIARILPMVSLQRREQALRFSHTFGRFTCLKGYELLLQCISQAENASDEASRQLCSCLHDWTGDFVYNEHGKPFFQSRSTGGRIEGAEFSLSHCRNAIAVVIHNSPVGIDAESFREPSPPLLRRTMNAQEIADITNSDNPTREFTILWTRKEAVLKLNGTGLVDNLPDVLTNCAYTEKTILNEEKKYVCTICKSTP